MWYVEWCSEVKHRRGRMIPVSDVQYFLTHKNPGYSSIYMFDENAAKEIHLSGSSRGLGRYSVGANSLVIDLDNGDTYLEKVENEIAAKGYEYSIWRSGHKGYHIYIFHEFVNSPHLPYTHKLAVIDLIKDAEKVVDMSLYQHGRLLSLPGRPHKKTGRKKELVKHVKGVKMPISIIEEKRPSPTFSFTSKTGTLEKALMQLLGNVSSPPFPGNRHTAIWSTAESLIGAGLSVETVAGIMTTVNSGWPSPKPEEEVIRAVEQAAKKAEERE